MSKKISKWCISVLCGLLVVFNIVLAIPISVSAEPASENRISVTDKNIRYLGHKEIKDGKARIYFECGLELAFTGTSIKLDLGTTTSSFLYSIDGGAYKEVSNVSGIYTLKENMVEKVHVLKLYSPWENYVFEYTGFILDTGACTVARKNTTIEFIGDSITAGYVGGKDNLYGYQYSHAFIASELLGFSHNTVAFGGITLLPDAGSDKLGMAKRYYKMHLDFGGETPNWNTREYVPDYLVVNLGTNDVAEEDVFRDGYIEFLTKLRESYSDTTIFVVAPLNGKFRAETEMAVNMRKTQGDTKIKFIDTTGWLAINETTDRLHPTVDAQKKIAQLLATEIENYISGVETQPKQTIMINEDVVKKADTEMVKMEKVEAGFRIDKTFGFICAGLLGIVVVVIIVEVVLHRKGRQE